MKTDTREYTDGTEPDVYRRWCCDGQCKQGRLCPKQMPAEAATDVGQEEEPNFYSKELLLKEIFDFAMAVVIVGTAVVVVSYLAGRYL